MIGPLFPKTGRRSGLALRFALMSGVVFSTAPDIVLAQQIISTPPDAVVITPSQTASSTETVQDAAAAKEALSAPKVAAERATAQRAAAARRATAGGEEGGAQSTFTTSFGATAGRNLDLDPGDHSTDAQLTGTLNYLYKKTTKQTQLSFSAGVQPQTGSDTAQGFYPSLSFGLDHALTARTKVNVRANYNEAKVTDQSLGFDQDTGTIIEYDGSGTRIVKNLSAGIEGGIDMPLGYTLGVSQNDVDYRDLSGSSYSPSQNTRITGGLRATVSPMTTLNLDASHSRYQSENIDRTRRLSDQVSLGLQQRIDAVNSFNVSVGDQQIETRRLSRGTTTERGATFGFGLNHEDPLGVTGLSYDRSITENGTRDALRLSRSRETAVGTFSGNIGLSQGDSSDTDWIGMLDYRTELPRNTLRANFARSVQSNDDGDDVVVTRLSGNIGHSLSDVNMIDFGLTASASKYPNDRDTLRVDATMTYRHSLTSTVDLETGVRMQLAQDSRKEDAQSQSLFMTMTRRFDFLH